MRKRKGVPQVDLSLVSERDWIRLAAFIDGEGSIGIGRCVNQQWGKHNPSFTLQMSVVNTDARLILWCVDTFGGYPYPKKQQSPKHSQSYTWVATGKLAVNLLSKCMPYFIIKGHQAELAIRFSETFTTEKVWCSPNARKWSDETIAERETLRVAMKDARRSKDPKFQDRLNEMIAPIGAGDKHGSGQ